MGKEGGASIAETLIRKVSESRIFSNLKNALVGVEKRKARKEKNATEQEAVLNPTELVNLLFTRLDTNLGVQVTTVSKDNDSVQIKLKSSPDSVANPDQLTESYRSISTKNKAVLFKDNDGNELGSINAFVTKPEEQFAGEEIPRPKRFSFRIDVQHTNMYIEKSMDTDVEFTVISVQRPAKKQGLWGQNTVEGSKIQISLSNKDGEVTFSGTHPGKALGETTMSEDEMAQEIIATISEINTISQAEIAPKRY
jgi:hypothetical protein